LAQHPQIYLPSARKELHFFDDSFDRGTDWYSKFFSAAGSAHSAVGEITPKYLYVPSCRDRIQSVLGDEVRFLVLLRNPVDRAFSQFTAFSESAGQEPVSFSQYLHSHPDALLRGEYFRQLVHYCESFPRESFLVLIHEETHRTPETEIAALREICLHLKVDPEPDVRAEPVGRSLGSPRSRWLTRTVFQIRDWLRSRDMDFMINVAKKSGMKSLLYSGKSAKSEMASHDRQRLAEHYREHISQLEFWLGRDLDVWKS